MMTFIVLDLMAILAALLVALNCGLLGNFLVLRQQSMMGDAISHAVLPGIVVGFLLSQSRDLMPMLIGAMIAAFLTTFLIELIRRITKINSAAIMGVIFSIMFALGVWLLEISGAKAVDLDASCVLYGLLQDIIWLTPRTPEDLARVSTWLTMPAQVRALLVLTLVVFGLIFYFFRQLVITSFDAEYADAIGIKTKHYNTMLMLLVAIVSVASFEAVGSILVIALLICPAAIARLLTQDMRVQVRLSLLFATVSVLSGYGLAASAPTWLGVDRAISAPGMIVVALGVIFFVAIVSTQRQQNNKARLPSA